jgi:hypothetical protein
MTLLGAALLDVLGLLLALWLLNLVRLGRLYVGYALVLVLSIVGTLCVVSVPPLRAWVSAPLSALFPGTELVVVACGAFLLILVYVLTQLTLIANRLSSLVQELALREVPRTPDEMESPSDSHAADHASAAQGR